MMIHRSLAVAAVYAILAQRMHFGAGQGDWKSTEWVANAVKISFSLGLKPKT